MRSNDFLQAAIDVQNQRAAEYDQPGGERSMGSTVVAFNAITGRELTEAEGWLFLQVLKDVRQWSANGYHHDSALDGVAYSALKAEALHGEQKTDQPQPVPQAPVPENWKKGDSVCFSRDRGSYFTSGQLYEVLGNTGLRILIRDDQGTNHEWTFDAASSAFVWVRRP